MSVNPPTTTDDARQAWLRDLEAQLAGRRQQHLLRELHPIDSAAGPEIVIDGKRCLQFCTNNYLGLTTDPEVVAAAREATERFGTGAGASRLVAGSMALHHELEAELARFKHAAAALLFPTGFMANLAALTTFAGEADAIVSDKLNHASLLDAAKFSGASHRTFPHRRYERAEELLARAPPAGRRLLVTDAVFSMDGDLADLPAAGDAAERHGALLIVDEAHGTGVLGARGAGVAELQQCEERIALSIGTLSKALGSVGGFIAGPRAAIDTLINTARSFIYTTALPPACAAAALAALRIVQREPARRRRLMDLSRRVKGELTALGYACGDSASPIIPVILGSADAAIAAAQFLLDRGVYVPAIRPPSVPPNTARLRISVMSTHTDGQVEQLLTAMRALRTQRGFTR